MEVAKSFSATDCPCCWEQLGDQRMPYSLSCGHTLCLDCIKRLGRNSSQFKCSLCGELVSLKSVKRNYTLHQLLTQLKRASSGDFFNPALTTSFDTIELEQLLDRGASGEVHRGTWQSNDVAVKIFASGQITAEVQDSFRREVCVMSSLRHPNVVLLLAACPHPPRLAIVMEYVGGGSLYSHLYINKTGFEPLDIVKLLIDVSRGLQYLHSINILHRDLKSKNVLLTGPPPRCQAKLCDFGLARMRLESATMTGNIGTVHWTAPEVLNCARYHFSADVYGLGMVIYETIARSIPFNGLPPPAVIVAVLLRKEKPKLPPGCDEELSKLMDMCLSWEPDQRPSISTVLSHLSAMIPEPASVSSNEPNEQLFDHVDSLGHVMVELEFDETDMDSDLMEFLLAQNDSVESTGGQSKEEEESESEAKDFDSPLFVPNKDGVVTKKEMEEFSKLSLSSSIDDIPSYAVQKEQPQKKATLPHPYLEYGGPAHQQQSYNRSKPSRPTTDRYEPPSHKYLMDSPIDPPQVPSLPSKDGIHPLAMPQYHDNRYAPIRLESGGMMDWAEDIDNSQKLKHSKSTSSEAYSTATEEEDLELARALSKKEAEEQLKNDYLLASELQKAYEQHGHSYRTHPKAPPPPPPIHALPLQQLPFRPSQKQLLMSQVSTIGRLKKLNPVKTKVKQGFRMGKVVGLANEDKFTLQDEVRHFQRGLLNHVEFKEPPPFDPIGRVVEIKPFAYVKSVVNKINRTIEEYDKQQLKHIECKEKNPLPTAEDIEMEKAAGFESDPETYTMGGESSMSKTKGEGSESSPESLSLFEQREDILNASPTNTDTATEIPTDKEFKISKGKKKIVKTGGKLPIETESKVSSKSKKGTASISKTPASSKVAHHDSKAMSFNNEEELPSKTAGRSSGGPSKIIRHYIAPKTVSKQTPSASVPPSTKETKPLISLNKKGKKKK